MFSFFSNVWKIIKCKIITSRIDALEKEISFFEDYIAKTAADPNNNSVRKLVAKTIQDSWLPRAREQLKDLTLELVSNGCVSS